MGYKRKQVQISAFIAQETKAALDAYVAATGLKKNRVIDEAIERHLGAVTQIPADMIIETHLTTTPEGWEMVWDMITTEREPSPELVEGWERHFEFLREDDCSLEEELARDRAAEDSPDAG